MIKSIVHNAEHAVLRFSGVVTSQQIYDARKAVIEHPEFSGRKYHIWIFESVDDIMLDANQMKIIQREDLQNSKINPILKVALVCDTDVAYGMCRMYEGFAGDIWNISVFRKLQDAYDWVKE